MNDGRQTVDHKNRGFDAVVVGGGSAGAAMAARLVAAGASVCLVEAGPDYGRLTGGGWPPDLLDPLMLPTSHDWDPEGGVTLSRARVLGGCSAHNGCRSRGRVRLRSTDPTVLPEIDLRFLSDEAGDDIEILLDGLAKARALARTPQVAPLLGQELEPGDGLSREELIAFARGSARGYWHAVGTCAMLPPGDPRSVVTPDGQVHGVERVHVADNSIVAEPSHSNTNLLAIALAELLAARLTAGARA